MTARIASALALVAIASAKKYNTDAKRMPDAGILNVHVIAHTHDDGTTKGTYGLTASILKKSQIDTSHTLHTRTLIYATHQFDTHTHHLDQHTYPVRSRMVKDRRRILYWTK